MKCAKILFIFFFSCTCLAKPPASSGVPSSINHIETHRVSDQLLRVIKHNMELHPALELELFETPDMTLAGYKKLEKVMWNGKEIEFKSADAIYVESINLTKSQLLITFDYFPPKGEEIQFSCSLDIKQGDISNPICK